MFKKSEKSGKVATKIKQAIVTAGREQGKSAEEIAEAVRLADSWAINKHCNRFTIRS